jgi:hypothetical protein
MFFTKLIKPLALSSALLAQACIGSIGPEDAAGENPAAKKAEQVDNEGNAPSNSASELVMPGDNSEEAVSEASTAAAEAIRSCEDLGNDEILAAVYGGPKVPAGFPLDELEVGDEGEGAWPTWGKGCSASLDAARKDAEIEAEKSAGWLTGSERTTPYFHEIDIAISEGAYTIHFRKTRCDYFDGQKLAGEATPEALAELAVYLWYSRWSITNGYNALHGIHEEEDGALTFTLCEAQTSFGECGACDEVMLLQASYKLSKDGSVTLPEASQPIRMLVGSCDN